MNTKSLRTHRELARELRTAGGEDERAGSLRNLINILLTANGALKTQSIQIHNTFRMRLSPQG